MSGERMVRRTLGLSNRSRAGRTQWARLARLSEQEMQQAARTDRDNPLWTSAMLREAELVTPPSVAKAPVTLPVH